MSIAAPERSPLRLHHPVGASTGYMTDLRGDWQALAGAAAAVSSFAVELAALGEDELPGLAQFLSGSDPLPFRFLSVHGPVKRLSMPEPRLVEALCALGGHPDAIVMHPDAIRDPASFSPLGARLVLENMDARKAGGRTVAELEPFFAALPEAGFCLDLAHSWSLDPTMGLAHVLLDRFSPRLRHLHLSSLSPELHHEPLSEADEQLFAPVLARCSDVAWILEAAPPRR